MLAQIMFSWKNKDISKLVSWFVVQLYTKQN